MDVNFVEQPLRNGHVFYYPEQIRLKGADYLKGVNSTAAHPSFPSIEVCALHSSLPVR